MDERAPSSLHNSGFYPAYLYYRELETLILAYGNSGTEEFAQTWPAEIMNSTATITSFFDKNVPRYGDSFVFRSYRINSDQQYSSSHTAWLSRPNSSPYATIPRAYSSSARASRAASFSGSGRWRSINSRYMP